MAVFLTVLIASAATAQDSPSDATNPEAPASTTEQLIEILRDDAARASLIAALERASEDVSDDNVANGEAAATAAPPPSLSRRLAETTQGAAESIAGTLTQSWRQLTRGPQLLSGFRVSELGVLADAFRELLITIFLTVGVFLVLRRFAIPLYRRLGTRAASGNVAQSGLIFIGAGLLDALTVLSAWAIGYAVAISFLGEFGFIGIRQTLYLNAFLFVEMAKVGIRLILSPATGALRPIPLSDHAARYIYRRSNVIVSLLGYGQMLLFPIINQGAGFAAGRSFTAFIASLALAYLVYLVLRNRRAVARWLATDPATGERKRGFFAALSQQWHWFVLAFLAWVFLVLLTQPAFVALDLLEEAGKILIAVLVGLVVTRSLSRGMRHGVVLPAQVTERFPALETRLNAFVPQALFVLRSLVLLSILVYGLQVVGLIDFGSWAGNGGSAVILQVATVLIVLLVAFTAWLMLSSWVEYRLNPDFGRPATARETTLLTLLRNAATIAILVITLMVALSELGLNIGPLLASAGVLGLAIGFGAQKMVQDIITGVFIQFENAINVGDVITAGGITGGVEKLTVRSVSLRDVSGVYHIIPFSSVDMVSNFTRDFSYHVADMGIAYREDIDEAREAMFEGFEALKADPEQGPNVLGDFEWFGVQSLGDSAVVMRGRIKTLPGKQWGVGRTYNGIMKKIFDARGIEIPFPHQTVYFGENKDGSMTTLRLSKDEGGPSSRASQES